MDSMKLAGPPHRGRKSLWCCFRGTPCCDDGSMAALPPPPVGLIVRPAQLEEAERIVKQLQQAMKAGGGNAYVSFLPENQGSRDKAQPESKVRNLMDDMSAPLAQTDAVDVGDLNQQLHTISEEK